MLPISSAPEPSPALMEEEVAAPIGKKKRNRIRKKDRRTAERLAARLAGSKPYQNQKAMAKRVEERYDLGNFAWAKYELPESCDTSPFAGAPGIMPERVANLEAKPVYVLPAAHDK